VRSSFLECNTVWFLKEVPAFRSIFLPLFSECLQSSAVKADAASFTAALVVHIYQTIRRLALYYYLNIRGLGIPNVMNYRSDGRKVMKQWR